MSSARTPPSYERFPVPEGAVVRAWHREQDGLLHYITKIVCNVPLTYTSGPRQGQSTYGHRYETTCGYWVFQTNDDASPMLRSSVSCLECLADRKDLDDE